jgi:hypothetical protein
MQDTNTVLAALRHPPKVHAVNGVTVCKPFMKAGSCAYENCRHAHLAKSERPVCYIWSRYGVCTRGDECWFQHPVAAEVSPDLGLETSITFGSRVVCRCRDLLGDACVLGVGRAMAAADTKVVVLLATPYGAAHALRTILEADPHFAAILSRTYVLEKGWSLPTGLCTPSVLLSRLLPKWHELRAAAAAQEAPLRVRLRGFPSQVEASLEAALDAATESGEPFAAPGGGVSSRCCVACVDAVSVFGRTYVACWETHAIASEPHADDGSCDVPSPAEQGRKARPEGSGCGGRSEPRLPSVGCATLDDLVFHAVHTRMHAHTRKQTSRQADKQANKRTNTFRPPALDRSPSDGHHLRWSMSVTMRYGGYRAVGQTRHIPELR